MFKRNTYTKRREVLKKSINSGIILILGNSDSPMNYQSNIYQFRQDSNFLYYFGLDSPNLIGIIDIDNNTDYILGNNVDIEDIIWMGYQPSLKNRASEVGVKNTDKYNSSFAFFKKAISSGRKVHYLPPYRANNILLLSDLLVINHKFIKNYVSVELIKAVVKQRSIKDKNEIVELEKAVSVGYNMHTTAMKMAKEGEWEQNIAGKIEGIAISGGGTLSFPVILSQDGQTLHNHYHGNILEKGRLMITDAGAESSMHYACDFTRTVPVGGKFSQKQKEIYEIVLQANQNVTDNSKPNVFYKDMHLLAAKTITNGLKKIGLMKGNTDEAVRNGAHALFMPHGLGHMMGLDVHDMEDLGEDYVGYNEEISRSNQFGLAYLRLGRRLQEGFVITNEPGIYFIPQLIDKWKAEKINTEFINFDKLEDYKTFGGIRIEDDLLITKDSCEMIGKHIPKSISDIENLMQS